jgi:RNA polymerase sigma-70 factor (ECF subfamily)
VEDIKLNQAVSRFYGRLYRAAMFMCGDPWMAEDIVQDTFLAARKGWAGFRGESSAYTWLYRIMLNTFRRKLREKQPELSLEDLSGSGEEGERRSQLEGDAEPPPALVERSEQARLVRQAVNAMPPHHREVLVLRFLEDCSYEEIAKRLDCSIGTVKSRLHYALKRVGERIRSQGAAVTADSGET